MSLLDLLKSMPEVAAAAVPAVGAVAKVTRDKVRKEVIIAFAKNHCGYNVPKERNKQLFDAAKPMYARKFDPPEQIRYEFYAVLDKIDFDPKYISRNQKKQSKNEILRSHMGEYLSRPAVYDYIMNS